MPVAASGPLLRAPTSGCWGPQDLPRGCPHPSCFHGEGLTVWLLLAHFFLEFIHVKARSLMFITEQGCGD